MARRLEQIFKDRDKICFVYVEEGKPPDIVEYWTIRGGITWPSINAPGYYCIFGLKDEPTLTDKYPLELLAEGDAQLPEKFAEKVVLSAKRLHCEKLFVDLRDENKGHEDSLYNFVRKHKIEGIRLSDSSEFDDPERGSLLIKQWHHDKALVIKEGTILSEQLKKMERDSLKDERFYAVMALIRVLASFEFYPWHKPSRRAPSIGFSSWLNRNRKKDDGEYKEIYVR